MVMGAADFLVCFGVRRFECRRTAEIFVRQSKDHDPRRLEAIRRMHADAQPDIGDPLGGPEFCPGLLDCAGLDSAG